MFASHNTWCLFFGQTIEILSHSNAAGRRRENSCQIMATKEAAEDIVGGNPIFTRLSLHAGLQLGCSAIVVVVVVADRSG